MALWARLARPPMASWFAALLFAAGAFLALEALYLAVRHSLRKARLRAIYQTWALTVVAAIFLLRSELGLAMPKLWQGFAVAASTLSAFLLYLVLSAAVFQRPVGAQGQALVPKLIRDVLGWLVFASALVTGLAAFGVTEVSTLLVSTTVLSAVLGFALQDVLKNLFAGMAVQAEQPFAAGDWLLLDGRPARVVDMSWRATHLRDNEGVSFFEPNAKLAGERLQNLGNGEQAVGWSFRVGLPYDTPPARARAALLAAAHSAAGVAADPAPQVFLESFGDSSMVYRLRVWTHDVGGIMRFTDAVNSRIWYHLQRARIAIPFPMRTVQWHDAAGEAAHRVDSDLARRQSRIDGLELFAPLAPEQRERLARAAAPLFFDHGEKLVREGEDGDSLFVVDSGQVLVTRAAESGDSQPLILAMLGPGECFGEMSLLTGAPRSATVTAEGGCEVLRLDATSVAPILAADPSVAESLSRLLAAREAATRARLDDRRGRAPLSDDSDHASLLERIRAFFRL